MFVKQKKFKIKFKHTGKLNIKIQYNSHCLYYIYTNKYYYIINRLT
jgi:hypothetical protein